MTRRAAYEIAGYVMRERALADLAPTVQELLAEGAGEEVQPCSLSEPGHDVDLERRPS